MLRGKYFIPSFIYIWKAINVNENSMIYGMAVLLYPLAALYLIIITVFKIFIFLIERLFWLMNPNARIVKGKVALLTVGTEIKYVLEDELEEKHMRESRIRKIDGNKIYLENTARYIKRRNFVIWNDNLVAIVERNNFA
jgi:hypothetical protein